LASFFFLKGGRHNYEEDLTDVPHFRKIIENEHKPLLKLENDKIFAYNLAWTFNNMDTVLEIGHCEDTLAEFILSHFKISGCHHRYCLNQPYLEENDIMIPGGSRYIDIRSINNKMKKKFREITGAQSSFEVLIDDKDEKLNKNEGSDSSLNKRLVKNRKFDLVIALNVVETFPLELQDQVLDYITEHAACWVAFSIDPSNQQNHRKNRLSSVNPLFHSNSHDSNIQQPKSPSIMYELEFYKRGFVRDIQKGIKIARMNGVHRIFQKYFRVYKRLRGCPFDLEIRYGVPVDMPFFNHDNADAVKESSPNPDNADVDKTRPNPAL